MIVYPGWAGLKRDFKGSFKGSEKGTLTPE